MTAPIPADLSPRGARRTDHVLRDLTWFEEQLQAHARDPQQRVDVAPSSRHVRVELDGQLPAESTRPLLLFETTLPDRCYLPREDVGTELLPIPVNPRIAGLVCFSNEKVDLVVGGERQERPVTPWS